MTTASTTIRLPPPVRPGDRVGVAALSGPVDPGRLERGLAALEARGFEPVVADNVTGEPHLLFAGSDEERLAGFHRLASDPSLKAIFFARGGYGVTRILDRIDWPLLARHPRAYVGYSDLTPLLDAVVRRLGLVAFHGPMVAADWARGLTPDEESSLLRALAGELPLTMPLTGWLRPGSARGRLVGGCLSMLVATLATPAASRLEGAILVLEDVNEPPYRLDRMLTQLRLAGALDGLAGLVLGHFDEPPVPGVRARELAAASWPGEGVSDPEESAGGREDGELWPSLLAQALAPFDWPVAYGLPCGHSPPNHTVPLGLEGSLDAAHDELRVGLPGNRDGRVIAP